MNRSLVPSLVTLLAATGCNTEPTTFVVRIGPDDAMSSQELNLEFISEARDANGDTISYVYEWTRDGEAVSGVTGPTVPVEETAKGQVWAISVQADDGKDLGAAATDEITILNTPPTTEASATSTAVRSDAMLQMTATADDYDGDEVTIEYYWTRDGEATTIATPTVLPEYTYPGEIWVGHAVGNDGEDRGEPSTVEIEILNTPPVVDELVLTPDVEGVFTDDDIVATVQASDEDGQEVILTYTWTIDGTEVLSGVDETILSSTLFQKHQTVEVTVVPDDTVDEGEPVSASRVVQNTLPTVPEIAVVPEQPIPTLDDMHCQIQQPSFDLDGDPITYRIEWTVDGEAYTGPTLTTDLEGDTIPTDQFFDDEEWECRVIAADDDAEAPAAVDDAYPLTWTGPRVFTPCGKTGRTGPSQSDCDGDYTGTTLEGEVTVDEGLQSWEVVVPGTYRITARGAQGAGNTSYRGDGGTGAVIAGDFVLDRGDIIVVAVGQEGSDNRYEAGGGGGSWVMTDDDTALLVAGGGGASGWYAARYGYDGCNAQVGEYAGRGSYTTSTSSWRGGCSGSKGYGLGEGGDSPGSYGGNGGGGLLSDGQNDPSSWAYGEGGKSWENGVEGGSGDGSGGFGAGGSGEGNWSSGGGGGYSGGDASRMNSGGGGSYNGGTDQSNSTGNTGDGTVTIDWLSF